MANAVYLVIWETHHFARGASSGVDKVFVTQGADGYLAVRIADVAETEENRARIAHALRRTADLLDPN